MSITIGAKPENDFTNPLGLMSDCHRRIERFLDTIIAVAEQAHGTALSPVQHESLDVALRYFEKAAPLHTQDEEASLFPRLRAAGDETLASALATVDALESDHQTAEAMHNEIDWLGRLWLEAGVLPADSAQRLVNMLHELRLVYQRHIAIEDNDVFPLAGRVLAPQEVRTVGREMAQRRGLDPDAPHTLGRCASRRVASQSG